MQDLKKLVDIVSKNKIKQADIVDIQSNSVTLFKTLYDGIANNKFETDEEAAEFLYKDNKNKLTYVKRLKRGLKERLINSLFFLDINQPNFKEIQKAYYTCYRNIAAEKILLGRGARQPAMEIAEKTLRKAIQFEFTDIILSIVRDLRTHYGNIVGDRKRFEEYNFLVKKYTQLSQEEMKAEEYYFDLSIDFINSKSTKTDILQKAEFYHDELRKTVKTHQSYRLNLFAFLLFALKHKLNNNHRGTLKVCQEALAYFQTKEQLGSRAVLSNFQGIMVEANIKLGHFENAEVLIKSVLEQKKTGTYSWYITSYQYILLLFYSRKFQKAFDIYQEGVNHPGFHNQNKTTAEYYRIYEAYIFYFISLKKIVPDSNNPLKRFRVSKFLNEVPTFSKDKQGTNISIIIVQILILLQQKKYSEIIDRMEPLKIYNHRYLRKDETYRSNCFIKMLLQLPQANFHKVGVVRKSQKYWKKLQEVPFYEANQHVELEVVPYEMLWEFVLESLDEKFH